jgi:hypothetical protein
VVVFGCPWCCDDVDRVRTISRYHGQNWIPDESSGEEVASFNSFGACGYSFGARRRDTVPVFSLIQLFPT